MKDSGVGGWCEGRQASRERERCDGGRTGRESGMEMGWIGRCE
jgi:hypothetical protein